MPYFSINTHSSEKLLAAIINELGLIPDILTNSSATIKNILLTVPLHLDKKEQSIIAKIYELLSKFGQPATLLNESKRLIEQQSLEVVEGESAATEATSSQVTLRDSLIDQQNSVRLAKRPLRPESLIKDLVVEIEELLPALLGNYFLTLVPAFKDILDFYKHFLTKWRAANEHERKQLFEPLVVVSLKAAEKSYYLMQQKVARQILSRDLHGYLRKTNASGNHAVSISKELVKKGSLEKGELDPILPGMEKIVVSFCNLLGESLVGEILAAPTTLIKLDQIVFYKVHPQLSDPAQLAQFNTQYREAGIAPEALVSSLPNLITLPEEIGAFIQVGKTLHGCSLHDLLNLIEKFHIAQKLLNQDQLQSLIASQLTNSMQQDQAIMSMLATKLEKEELENFYKLLKKLPELFPQQTAAQIIFSLPKLPELFDLDNYTALLLISLLTNPCDGKADNYMAEFSRDAQQQITAIKIKGIDNDQALADSIVSVKTTQQVFSEQLGKNEYKTLMVHFTGVKCVLYSLPMLRQVASVKVIKKFLELSPEVLILSWLVENYNDDQDYIRFLKNKPSELDIPLRLDITNVLSIYNKLCYLKNFLSQHLGGQLTNQQIFSELEPLLSRFYEKILIEQNGDPLLTQSRIYHGNGRPCPTIEDTLGDELDRCYLMEGMQKITWREKLQSYNRTEHYYKYRVKTVQEIVETFVKHIHLVDFIQNEAQLWPILKLLANFDFLRTLPLNIVQIEKLFLEAILKKESTVVGLLLNCSEFKNPNKLYPLHLAVKQVEPSAEVIAILLRNKKINIEIFDAEGNTALSLVNPKCEAVIDLLVTAGMDIDMPHIATGKTLIDRSIDENNLEDFVKLIKRGAGKKLNARKALAFISQYQNKPDLQVQMQQALDSLCIQNADIAALATLNAITQEINPTNNLLQVEVLNTHGIERRYIKPEAMNKIFELAPNGSIKGIRRSNTYGRRAVAFVEHEGQKMHIKSHPEIFATEEGVKVLWRLLFPQGGIAESFVLSVFDPQKGEPFPVIISRHVEGENLQQAVQDLVRSKAMEEQLDARRFSEVLIMTLLINPEDDKPDNKILRYFINKEGLRKLEIVGIDNDHAFVFPLLLEKGHRTLQVKTIVACLDQMREPLHPDVREIILKLSARDLLEKWLRMVEQRQRWADQLFSETVRQRFFNDKDNPILTRMPLPRGIVAHMYGAIVRMQQILKKQPHISQMNFMSLVEPSFVAYKYVMDTVPNPGARFHDLFQRQYSTIMANRFDTLITGKHILQSAKIPDKDMIANTVSYGPIQALYELDLAAAENEKLSQVKQQLLKGDVSLFQALLLSSSRARVLKELSLKDLQPNVRVIVLKTLQNVSLEYLDLSGCLDVSNSMLKPILENSPNLLALNISGCEKLTVDILAVVAKNCEALKKLYLNDLSWPIISVRDKPLFFQSLQRLWTNGLLNLKEIKLHAPQLRWWSCKLSPNLKSIELQGQALEYLSLEESGQVIPEVIHRLLGQSPELLKSMQLKGNIVLLPRFLAWLNGVYGVTQWQTNNVPRMVSKANQIILQNLDLNDADLNAIAYFGRNIKHIDLVGATKLSWLGVITCLDKLHQLESIRKTDYSNLSPKMTEVKITDCIEGFALGYSGAMYSISRAGKTRIHDLSGIDHHFVEMQDDNKTAIATVYTSHNWLFVGTRDGMIKIWDMFLNQSISQFRAHSYSVKSLRYLPAKSILISASEDKTIKLWDIYTGKLVKSISTRAKINALELFDHGLVVGFDNGVLARFDYRTGEQLDTVNLHPSAIVALKKVSDKLVLTASSDYTAKIYDITTGDCIRTFVGHERAVTAIEVLQGNLVATGSLDKNIKIWDVFTGECVVTLSGHERKITSLQVIENKLVSASEDNSLRIWEFPIKEIVFDLIPRRANLFEIIQQEALICLKVNNVSNKITIVNFCVDFIIQLLGKSGIGINQDVEKGEIYFSVNNQSKYFAINKLLVSLVDFINRSCLLESSVAVKRTAGAPARSGSPMFWRSARPSVSEADVVPLEASPRRSSIALRSKTVS